MPGFTFCGPSLNLGAFLYAGPGRLPGEGGGEVGV